MQAEVDSQILSVRWSPSWTPSCPGTKPLPIPQRSKLQDSPRWENTSHQYCMHRLRIQKDSLLGKVGHSRIVSWKEQDHSFLANKPVNFVGLPQFFTLCKEHPYDAFQRQTGQLYDIQESCAEAWEPVQRIHPARRPVHSDVETTYIAQVSFLCSPRKARLAYRFLGERTQDRRLQLRSHHDGNAFRFVPLPV